MLCNALVPLDQLSSPSYIFSKEVRYPLLVTMATITKPSKHARARMLACVCVWCSCGGAAAVTQARALSTSVWAAPPPSPALLLQLNTAVPTQPADGECGYCHVADRCFDI